MAFNVQFTKGIKNMLCSQFKTKKPALHDGHFGSQQSFNQQVNIRSNVKIRKLAQPS